MHCLVVVSSIEDVQHASSLFLLHIVAVLSNVVAYLKAAWEGSIEDHHRAIYAAESRVRIDSDSVGEEEEEDEQQQQP